MISITIKDIAKEAGVSTATVSYVINGTRPVTPEKRQRVLDVIEKTNYQRNWIAKSLRTKKTHIIGVLAEDILAFPTTRIINGISEYIEKTDYQMLLSDLRMLDSLFNQYDQIIHHKNKVNEALSFLIFGAKVDAVIYIGMFDRDISGIITNMNKPIVIAYSTSSDDHVCTVTYENEAASAESARQLIDKGHKKIAVITGLTHTSPAQLRLKGIKSAFKEAGMVLDEALIKHGDWERASGYACMKELLEQNSNAPPTAVLAMNDYMAIGAMEAIRESDLRVPQDISLIGFDNRDVSDFVFPKLTTVEINLKAIGFTSAQSLIQKLSGSGQYAEERSIIIPSELILRDTVAQVL